MTREDLLAQTLVDLADTLVDEFDVLELLTLLSSRSVSILGASAAGIMLAFPDGNLGVMASSSEAVRVLELFELQADAGPCVDCYRSGTLIGVGDVAASSSRWPLFVDECLKTGFRSAHAFPMRLRGTTLGALNLFGAEPGLMNESDLRVAQALADVATIAILQHRALQAAQNLIDELHQALNSRIAVEQAKGILAERQGLDMETAFAQLRSYARNNNLALASVARSVIEGNLSTEELSRKNN